MDIIIAILILLILAMVHELGHFFMGSLNGYSSISPVN